MLSESDLAILKIIVESPSKEVLVSGSEAFVDDYKFNAVVASRLAAMTAIREIDTDDGITKYALTATGRHMLSDPEVQRQLVTALGYTGY